MFLQKKIFFLFIYTIFLVGVVGVVGGGPVV